MQEQNIIVKIVGHAHHGHIFDDGPYSNQQEKDIVIMVFV